METHTYTERETETGRERKKESRTNGSENQCQKWFFYASSHLFIPLVTGHKKILSFQITEIHFNLIFHLYLYPFKLVDQLSYHFPISVPFPFPFSRHSLRNRSTCCSLLILCVCCARHDDAVCRGHRILSSVMVMVVVMIWSVVRLSLHKSCSSNVYIRLSAFDSFLICIYTFFFQYFFLDAIYVSFQWYSVRL